MKICCVKECNSPVKAKGFCGAHYRKFRKYGDATVVKMVQLHGMTPAERWAHYTDKSDGCWLWNGYKDPHGYGRLNIDGIPILAHRLGWELVNGPIPAGKYLCHSCDTPACVSPAHMFVGDPADNSIDMWTKGRARPGHVAGEKHGCAKLTDDQVREIRKSVGASHVVGEKYGISGRQVRAIRNREAWTHIEE